MSDFTTSSTGHRTFVPFQSLWKMPIDVPYSLLIGDGGMAWSCGQIALDQDSNVIGANDIVKQSEMICDYIEEILHRGNVLTRSTLKMLLYYVPTGKTDRLQMLDVFRRRFGEHCLLVPLAVPHYYYDGILLEVDLFCDESSAEHVSYSGNGISIKAIPTDSHLWVYLEAVPSSVSILLQQLSVFLSDYEMILDMMLSEHWFAPSSHLPDMADVLESRRLDMDIGALVDSGPDADMIQGHFMFARGEIKHSEQRIDSTNERCLLVRQCGDITWLQARSFDHEKGLVDQTTSIMKCLELIINELGLSFMDVVKSTTHYEGGNTPEELHDNMRVRNACYSKPGPASTGLPVFGFSDKASRVVVDLTLKSK